MAPTPEEGVVTERAVIAPEELLETDRASLITGMIVARAWRDPEFRDRLVRDPKDVLAAEGLRIPAGVAVRVFEDTPEIKHVALTTWTSEPEELLPLFRELLPLPEGSEVRLIQNTEQAVCLVIPLAPAGPETVTDVDRLRRLAPRASVWVTNVSVVENLQVAAIAIDAALAGTAVEAASIATSLDIATQAITVTNIVVGETEAAATTTTVAAEAEATAVEAEAVATTTTVLAEAEVAAVEAEAAATTTTAAAEVEVAGVEFEAAATSTTAVAEAEVISVAAIVLT
jgi:hypothetical protein